MKERNLDSAESVFDMRGCSKPFEEHTAEASVIEAVVEYFEENGKEYPWKVIAEVSETEGVPKKKARTAIGELRWKNYVVHAPPFRGEMELSDSES